MYPSWWFKDLELWKYTSSISPGIISVNVIYGILIVKNRISDGTGKTTYSWRNLIFPQTFWETICDLIFMQTGIKINKLKSFIVKTNSRRVSRGKEGMQVSSAFL